jgi:hypothetical protein
MSETQTPANIEAGETIPFGTTWNGSEYIPVTARVLSADADKVQVENPTYTGKTYGNRNSEPRTFTYKRTSKVLAARMGA